MPECGSTVDVYVNNAGRLAVGSAIYSPQVGYLTVMDVDSANCKIVVKNNCEVCNTILPGEPVPSTTIFSVGIPSCVDTTSGGSIEGVYLATDYVIPAVGNCVTVKVTRLGSIVTGAVVSIAGYQYTVGTVTDSETIEICNDGNGGPVGTAIEADTNNDGTLDHPIDVLSAPSPCDQTPVDAGLVVVCDGLNQTTIQGSIDNQIMIWNNSTEEWELTVLDTNTVDCTTTTSCLIIDSAAPSTQTYLVDVEDATIFQKPEYAQFSVLLIYINGDPYTLVEVISPTRIRVQPFFTVVADLEYDAGTVICIADCCEQCRPTVETMGRYNSGDDPEAIIIGESDTSFSIPNGVSVRNYFVVGAPTTDPSSGDPFAEGVLDFSYTNEGQCQRYIEFTSNFESVLGIPANVYANIEFRTANIQANTQSFAAMPIIGNAAAAIAPSSAVGGQLGNLLIAVDYKDLNTFKGMLYDREFVDPGDTITFYGHIRLTFNNTTGAPVNGDFIYSWRAWYKAWNYALGPVVGP